MTLKEYKKQRDSGGFSIEEQLKLSTNSKGENSLMINFLQELDELNQDSTFGEVYELLLGNKMINQESIFKSRPNTITYAFNCRYIDDHEKLVPERVRLGVSSNNNLKKMTVNTSNQAIGPINIGFRRYKNSGKNLTSNRKRVSSIAPEIKQQVSESIQQRRLGALAFSRNKTEKNTLKDYKKSIDSSNINNNTLEDKINKLNKYYPELTNYYINSTLNKASVFSRLNIINKLNSKFPIKKNKLNRTYKNIINRRRFLDNKNYVLENRIIKLDDPEITNYYLNSKLEYPNLNTLNRLITKFPTRKNKVKEIRNNLLQQQKNINNSAYEDYVHYKLFGEDIPNNSLSHKYNTRFQNEKEELKKKISVSFRKFLNKNNISNNDLNRINNYISFLKTNPELIEDSRPALQKILNSSINEEIKNSIREIISM
jgi:hypothetical protein